MKRERGFFKEESSFKEAPFAVRYKEGSKEWLICLTCTAQMANYVVAALKKHNQPLPDNQPFTDFRAILLGAVKLIKK